MYGITGESPGFEQRNRRVYGIRSRVRLIANEGEASKGEMSSERELEIVRIGRQLEKLANSDTPVSPATPGGRPISRETSAGSPKSRTISS